MPLQPTATILTTQLEHRPGCIAAALYILGDQWSPLLLGQLIQEAQTFSQLEHALPGISPRTLSARLERLAEHNIIVKKMYCQRPPRYRYQLTQKGIELQDILRAMGDWGNRYHKP